MKTAEIKDLVRQEIAYITPFDALEQEHINDAIRWIDSGANIFFG